MSDQEDWGTLNTEKQEDQNEEERSLKKIDSVAQRQ